MRRPSNTFAQFSAWAVMLVAAGSAGAQGRGPALPFVVAGCVETREPPTIDGRLDEQVWKRAGKATRFVLLNSGEKATEQTVAYLLYDRYHLFIGFHCEESQMDSLKASVREEDTTEVGADDSIEVFLIPPGNPFLKRLPERERYFHIMLNVLGTRYDEAGYGNPEAWDAKWTAAVSKGKDWWEAEVAIPFAALSTPSPKAGAAWKANFNRGEKRLGENSGWAPVCGSFHDPAHFGRVVFVRESDEGQSLEATALREGLLLPRVNATLLEVKETTAALRALKATVADARQMAQGLQRSAQRLTELKAQIQALPPPGVVEQWEPLDNELMRLDKGTDLAADKVLLLSSYTREQLAGKASPPAYSVFVSPAITNQKLLPHRFPRGAKPGTEISLSACPGEYEAATFVLYALRDLKNTTIEVSGLSSSKQRLPADVVGVRVVKCWFQAGVQVWETNRKLLTPELLLKDDGLVRVDLEKEENSLRHVNEAGETVYLPISTPTSGHLVNIRPKDAERLLPVTIPANSAKQFWVTVHVPSDVRPGNYRGLIQVRADGVSPRMLNLAVRVLPFPLELPNLTYSIYYTGRLTREDKGSISSGDKSPRQYLAEMENMKAHGVLHPTSYQQYDPDLLAQMFALREKAGLPKGVLYNLGHPWGPFKPEELEQLIADVRKWGALCAEHGYKEVYFYGIDEATGEVLKSQLPAWQAIHEAGGKTFVACYKGTFEAMGDLLDLAVYAGYPDREEAQKWRKVGHHIFCYANPQVGVEEPETYRRNFGLLLWKNGFHGAMDFAYQYAFNHIWNDFDDKTYRDHNFTYPTVDGVIDTVQWEGFREGVDDVRYLTTLLKAIEQVKANKAKRQLATEATKWVEAMDLSSDLQALRAKMVGWILRLRE